MIIKYLAPEVLRKEPYDFAVDWWCFGSVLYEMLYGLPPFYSKNRQEMFRAIQTRPLKLRDTISYQAKLILSGVSSEIVLFHGPINHSRTHSFSQSHTHSFNHALIPPGICMIIMRLDTSRQFDLPSGRTNEPRAH